MLDRTQVLVVGAGPVGLLAAMALSQRGIAVRIVDSARRAEGPAEGAVLHPRSLLLLQRMGLSDRLVQRGVPVDRTGVYLRVERVAVVEHSAPAAAYPFVLTLAHNDLVDVLEAELAGRGVHVDWLHRVHDIAQDASEVRARVGRVARQFSGYGVARTADVAGSAADVRADYLIATDGARSLAAACIGARRDVLSREHYAVIETRPGPDTGGEARVGLVDEHLVYSMWPVPGDRLRWVVQLDRALGHAGDAELLSLVGEQAPWFRPLPDGLERRVRLGVERWLSQPLGRGRIWLSGDAAHQTSPCASQSVNSGIEEAVELAECISLLLAGRGQSSLSAYGEGVRRHWERLLCTAGPPRRLPRGPAWSASQAERLVACLPAVGADMGPLLQQIGLSWSAASQPELP